MGILRTILYTFPQALAAYCPIGNIPCPTGAGGGQPLDLYMTRITNGIQTALFGMLAGMLIFYTVKLAMSSSEENYVTESRNAYFHAIFGAILITGASYLAATVPANSYGIVNAPLVSTTGILARVTQFFFLM